MSTKGVNLTKVPKHFLTIGKSVVKINGGPDAELLEFDRRIFYFEGILKKIGLADDWFIQSDRTLLYYGVRDYFHRRHKGNKPQRIKNSQ
jgi:hypothetical protein